MLAPGTAQLSAAGPAQRPSVSTTVLGPTRAQLLHRSCSNKQQQSYRPLVGSQLLKSDVGQIDCPSLVSWYKTSRSGSNTPPNTLALNAKGDPGASGRDLEGAKGGRQGGRAWQKSGAGRECRPSWRRHGQTRGRAQGAAAALGSPLQVPRQPPRLAVTLN